MKPKKWRTSLDDFITPIVGRTRALRGFNVVFPKFYRMQKQYFGVRQYGSLPAALKVARAYRDSLARSLRVPPPRSGGARRTAPFKTKPSANNASGIVGVGFNAGRWYAFYQPRTGKQVRRSFSIGTYGNDNARTLAIQWREEMIEELRRKP